MTTAPKARRPKSPPVPSKSLEGCVADVKKVYTEYSHGSFSRAELGSALGVSASSGPFSSRLASLRQFGLIEATGDGFKVTDGFMILNSNGHGTAAFKSEALRAIKLPPTFREVLEEFSSKLPSRDAVTSRLENQKKFNAEAASRAAAVLEESLRYAGVLDTSNNILPVRAGKEDGKLDGVEERIENVGNESDTGSGGGVALRVEVPVGDRKVVVHYPHDLTAPEAKKVGAVLAAIVS